MQASRKQRRKNFDAIIRKAVFAIQQAGHAPGPQTAHHVFAVALGFASYEALLEDIRSDRAKIPEALMQRAIAAERALYLYAQKNESKPFIVLKNQGDK